MKIVKYHKKVLHHELCRHLYQYNCQYELTNFILCFMWNMENCSLKMSNIKTVFFYNKMCHYGNCEISKILYFALCHYTKYGNCQISKCLNACTMNSMKIFCQISKFYFRSTCIAEPRWVSGEAARKMLGNVKWMNVKYQNFCILSCEIWKLSNIKMSIFCI